MGEGEGGGGLIERGAYLLSSSEKGGLSERGAYLRGGLNRGFTVFNFNFNLIVTQMGWVGVGAYLSLIGSLFGG